MTETTSLFAILSNRIGHLNIDIFFNLIPALKHLSAIVAIFISDESDI